MRLGKVLAFLRSLILLSHHVTALYSLETTSTLMLQRKESDSARRYQARAIQDNTFDLGVIYAQDGRYVWIGACIYRS